MELPLDQAQSTLLRDLLISAWSDLRYEIADTDNSTYKAALRDRESVLISILDPLTAAAAPV